MWVVSFEKGRQRVFMTTCRALHFEDRGSVECESSWVGRYGGTLGEEQTEVLWHGFRIKRSVQPVCSEEIDAVAS